MRGLAGALAFAALAAFSSLHWSALVSNPPVAQTLLIVTVVTATGLAIARLPRSRRWPWASAAGRIALVLVAAVGTLVVIGLPARLLLPAGWSELDRGIGRGLIAVQITHWPYHGSDDWVRRSLLLVMPIVLTAAAALAFWPARRGAIALRIAAVGLLVGLFGVAAVQAQPPGLDSGALLLVLLAAWLFMPVIARGRGSSAVALVLLAVAVALPLSALLPASKPVINYRALSFGQGDRFNWDHTYGPLDWPRDDQVVLRVDSVTPHYWKALSLDEFDGFRWVHSATDTGAHPLAELPQAAQYRWQTQVDVTVGSIDSGDVFSPGPILGTTGIAHPSLGDDGTAWVGDDLQPGDSYTVRAYAPDPSAARMRQAPDAIPGDIRRYTRFDLPGAHGLPAATGITTTSVALPLHGSARRAARARRLVLDSPYARTYRLARRLAARAPTSYDVVRRVEEYLRTTYQYSETPPARRYPLAAFLFKDKAGYCQQFSGAMALMLRMNGIPARVAGGFAPGEPDETTWIVTDSDAHSWVEVYFHGIGWVPFDPTPPGTPAHSVTSGITASAARGNEGQIAPLPGLGDLGRVGDFVQRRPVPTVVPRDPGAAHAGAAVSSGPQTPSGGVDLPLTQIGIALLAVGCAGLGLGWRRWLARSDAAGELGEVQAALEALGAPAAPDRTLAQLERQLADQGRQLAAHHVGLLGARRYGPAPIPQLDLRARRAFRKALTAGRGPVGRLRAYAALRPRRRPLP